MLIDKKWQHYNTCGYNTKRGLLLPYQMLLQVHHQDSVQEERIYQHFGPQPVNSDLQKLRVQEMENQPT